MKKRMSSTALAGLVLALAPAVQAANLAWNGSVSSDWHNADNWSEAYYPGQNTPDGYQSLDNFSLVNGATPPTVSTNLPFVAFSGHVNVFGDGVIKVVAGGNINLGTDVYIGRNDADGTVIVEGGTLTLNGFLVRGGDNSTVGRLEMTGGNVAWSNLRFALDATNASADALITLWGGELSVDVISFNGTQTQQKIDIQNGGLLVMSGDQTAAVAGWAAGDVTTGLITGSNGVARPDLEALGTVGSSGDLRWVTDGSETFVWATGAPPAATGTLILLK